MKELGDLVQRLREVREAGDRFLGMYAVEVAVIEPALDRVAEDVEHAMNAIDAATPRLIHPTDSAEH